MGGPLVGVGLRWGRRLLGLLGGLHARRDRGWVGDGVGSVEIVSSVADAVGSVSSPLGPIHTAMATPKTTRSSRPPPTAARSRHGGFGFTRRDVISDRNFPGVWSTSSQPSCCHFEMLRDSVPRTARTDLNSY